MANGEILIVTDPTGGDVFDVTTSFAIPFTRKIRADPIYTVASDGKSVDFAEAGRYLVICSVPVECTESTSVDYTARVWGRINTVASNYMWGYAYMNGDQSTQEGVCSFATVIDVAAGDDLDISCLLESTANPGSGQFVRTKAGSSLQIIKLDATWDYCRVRRSTNATISTAVGTFGDVGWNTQDEVDTGTFGHSTVTLPAEIEIKTTGKYLICVVVVTREAATGTPNIDLQAEVRLLFDGAELPGARVGGYMSDSNGCEYYAHNIFWYGDLAGAAGKKLKVQARKVVEAGTTTLRINQNRSSIVVVKVPDAAKSIICQDDSWSGSPQAADATTDVLLREEIEKDSAFVHAVDDHKIELNEDGSYLFGSTVYMDRDGTSTNHLVHRLVWRRPDLSTDIGLGASGTYDQGAIASNMYSGVGSSNGLIVPYGVDGQQFSLRHYNDSSSTDANGDFDNNDAGLPTGYSPIRVWAVKLDDWFSGMPKPFSGRTVGATSVVSALKNTRALKARIAAGEVSRSKLTRAIAMRHRVIGYVFGRALSLRAMNLRSRTNASTHNRSKIQITRPVKTRTVAQTVDRSKLSVTRAVKSRLVGGSVDRTRLAIARAVKSRLAAGSVDRARLAIDRSVQSRTSSLAFSRAALQLGVILILATAGRAVGIAVTRAAMTTTRALRGRSLGQASDRSKVTTTRPIKARGSAVAVVREKLSIARVAKLRTVAGATDRVKLSIARFSRPFAVGIAVGRAKVARSTAVKVRSMSRGFGRLKVLVAKVLKLRTVATASPRARLNLTLLGTVELTARTVSISFGRMALGRYVTPCVVAPTEFDLEIQNEISAILSELGRTVVIRSITKAYDSATRVAGASSVGSTFKSTPPVQYGTEYANDSVIKETDLKVFVQPGSFVPKVGDEVELGSSTFTVVFVREHYSGQLVDLYELAIRGTTLVPIGLADSEIELDFINETLEIIQTLGRKIHFEVGHRVQYNPVTRTSSVVAPTIYCVDCTPPEEVVLFTPKGVVRTNRMKVGIPAKNLPFIPSLNQVAELDGQKYNIVRIQPFSIGDAVLYYELELSG